MTQYLNEEIERNNSLLIMCYLYLAIINIIFLMYNWKFTICVNLLFLGYTIIKNLKNKIRMLEKENKEGEKNVYIP